MSGQDETFMRLALGQAKIALDDNRIPVGATLVLNGQIIAHGCKTGERHTLFDHAEHNACYHALWSDEIKNLEGFTVYSTLEPCLMCMSMLMTTRVSKIVYGLDDPYGGGRFLLDRHEDLPPRFREKPPTIEGGMLAEESAALLREFFLRQAREKHRRWSDGGNQLVKLAMEYGKAGS